MKTRIFSLILALAVLLSCLTACESTDTPSTSGGNISGKPAQSSVQNAEGSEEVNETETEPDYSWFEMPEETNSLTIYGYSFISTALRKAIDIFEKEYPDVIVDFKTYGDDEYKNILRTEIPSGRGPDVVLDGESLLPDICKTMSVGIFTDLGPFMANDADFNPEDYYENVMKGGMMFGKQYLLPVTFGMNMLMTTTELLEENGIDPESLTTWDGFVSACRAFHENNPGKPLFSSGSGNYYVYQFCKCCGFRMIDYEKNEISFSEARFRDMLDLCRLYCYPTAPANPLYGDEAGSLSRGDCLFAAQLSSTAIGIVGNCPNVRKYKKTPVLLTVPNEDGGTVAQIVLYAAVPAASENKLNAWRFTKILLSEEIQGGRELGDQLHSVEDCCLPVGNPVRKESLRRIALSLKYITPCTDADLEGFLGTADKITDTTMFPTIIRQYINEYMVPYITSTDGSNYDKQFAKFMNALELYKDE